MQHIAIVYFTKSGVTGRLAKSLVEGASEVPDIGIIEYPIKSEEIIAGRFSNKALMAELTDADAIVFGSPTYMGSVAAQFKAFADASSDVWTKRQWSGKLAAGFTCGSSIHGEQTSTLEYLITLANQHGMLWVGLDVANGFADKGINRMGCSYGVVAHAESNQLNESDLATARYLGTRLASILKRFH